MEEALSESTSFAAFLTDTGHCLSGDEGPGDLPYL
jgi:hypothetical protein